MPSDTSPSKGNGKGGNSKGGNGNGGNGSGGQKGGGGGSRSSRGIQRSHSSPRGQVAGRSPGRPTSVQRQISGGGLGSGSSHHGSGNGNGKGSGGQKGGGGGSLSRRGIQRSHSSPRGEVAGGGRSTSPAQRPTAIQRQTSGGGLDGGSSHIPHSGRRRPINRSRSAQNPASFGRSASFRRPQNTKSLSPDQERDFNLDDFATGPTPRESFGGAAHGASKYVRSAVATAANTTQTTLKEGDSSHGGGGVHRNSASTGDLLGMSDRMSDTSASLHEVTGRPSTSVGGGASKSGLNTSSGLRKSYNTSASVAQRFLTDNPEDDFELAGKFTLPPTSKQQQFQQQHSSATSDTLNMSQLKFPTMTSGGEMFEDEPMSPGGTSKKGNSSSKKSKTSNKPSIGSVFANRKDLREVDQSVNLMDSSKHYEPSSSSSRTPSRGGGGRSGGRSSNNNRRGSSMASISGFLAGASQGPLSSGTGGRSGRMKGSRRQSLVEVFLGESSSELPFNPKNKKFRSFYGGTNRRGSDDIFYEEESCWERMKNCSQSCCRILCSIPVLLLLVVVGLACILIPLVMLLKESPSPPSETVEPAAPAASSATMEPTVVVTSTYTVDVSGNEGIGAITSSLFDPKEVDARTQALQKILQNEANMEDLGDAGLEAVKWMAAYDPAMMVIVNSAPVVERFAMAAMYFAMNPEVSADSAGILGEQRQAGRLLGLRGERSKSRRSLFKDGWMSQVSICEWDGIDCENDLVVHLNVSHTNLMGSLPEELTLLTELIELDLSHNQIHGRLPSSYPRKLSKLEYVLLHSNQIGGTLPASIGDWTTVYHLDVSENLLTGTLPPTLAKLTQTRLLYLHRNRFSGSIPMELGHLPKIEYLYLGQNKLTGELPMDLLSRLSTVVDLRLEGNALTGTLPPEVESLHRLEFLILGNNRLNGELPDIFDRLHSLVEMDLHRNYFKGHLPETLWKASRLEILLLEHNKFSGPIPASWTGLTSLEKLAVDHNELTGEMPLCYWKDLTFGIAADCISKVDCECCSKCY